MAESLPWERKEGETDAAFTAFVAYRDQDPPRSLRRLHDELKSRVEPGAKAGRGAAPPLSTLMEWSSGYFWVARASAWDDELDRRKREAQAEAVAEMARRHADQSKQIVQTLLLPASALAQRIRKLAASDDLERLFPGTSSETLMELLVQGAKVMPKVVEIERLARGEPTAFIRSTSSTEMIPHADEATARAVRIAQLLHEAGALPDGAGGADDAED